MTHARHVIRCAPVRRRAFLAEVHPAFGELRRFHDADTRDVAPRLQPPEVMLDAREDVVGIDVTDDDERGVVRPVVRRVVRVQVVARHRLEVLQPADGRVAVGVHAERAGRQLGVEQLLRIVLAALQLRDDDRALRLAVVRLVEARAHALGLDEQHAVERIAGRGFEVGGLVDPGVAVPGAAEPLDDALHLVTRDVARALEVHVLDPVGDAGEARPLVF
jgi:hypothetical protein